MRYGVRSTTRSTSPKELPQRAGRYAEPSRDFNGFPSSSGATHFLTLHDPVGLGANPPSSNQRRINKAPHPKAPMVTYGS